MASDWAPSALARIRAIASRGMDYCDAMLGCDFVSDLQRSRIAKDHSFFWSIDFVAELIEQCPPDDPDAAASQLIARIERWEADGGCTWMQLDAPEGRPN